MCLRALIQLFELGWGECACSEREEGQALVGSTLPSSFHREIRFAESCSGASAFLKRKWAATRLVALTRVLTGGSLRPGCKAVILPILDIN